MHPSKNSLPEAVRFQICQMLSTHLAEAVDLQHQYTHAHWNVKGPHFIGLHKLFEELADQLDPVIDDIAERIVQLGGTPNGTVQGVTAATRLPEMPVNLFEGLALVQQTSLAAAAFAARVREGVDLTGESGDALTADLLTEAGRLLDKQVWLLDAHLQASR